MGADGEKDRQAPPLKGRLLARLAVLIVRHAALVSFVCCVAGIVSLMLLPVLAKSVYVDENALLPGSARATFSHYDTLKAHDLAREIQTLLSSSTDPQKDFRKWLGDRLDALGADYYFHCFCPPTRSFSILGFLSTSYTYEARKHCLVDGREQTPGVNAVGILRAHQGDGNEAIVLVTPFELENLTAENAIAMGLSLSLLDLLSRTLWLAKDVVWVAADSKYEKYTAVAAWLKEYHEPLVSDSSFEGMHYTQDGNSSRDIFFKRAGSITAGFVLEFTRGAGATKVSSLEIHAEGSNGQMPNMDMISVVNLLVSWRQQFHLTLEGVPRIKDWQWLRSVGYVFEVVGRKAAELRKAFLSHAKASFTTAEDYVNGVSVLLRSCWNQMLGVPTGSHGAFRDFQLDAVTLEVVSFHLTTLNGIVKSPVACRLIEGVLRSVNNLLEKFHQSLFLYIMVSPNKFVSISTYIIPFGLLLSNFPIQAAALCTSVKATPGSWTQAILVAILVETWSLGNAICPAILFHLFSSAPTRLAVWILLSGLCLAPVFCLRSDAHASDDWYVPLKSLTLGLTGIALGILSAVNFSVALAGALLLVPMCLSAQPLSSSWRALWKPKSGVISRVNAVLAPALTCFPLLVVLTILARESAGLWSFVELMWFWGSALYVSAFVVFLPCSILCLYIFFS
ncbi:hypothetical protein SELMODRAFT_97440 [Selaginella moellendorffii]|uniref:Glycosylphosphatidylinositol anchor attachment 1 protein n=1 Tax=Selaginella moellendorffii TaxID=88036 RepID=D8RMU0_SELML|nr:hypothetical protein SELMODRAFT_97440 [Selaginella moellendorffii]